MKDYLIWAGEKLEAVSGWDWDTCMKYLTSGKKTWITKWLSIENYLKEVK